MLNHFKASFLQDGVYFSNEGELFSAFETLFSEELLREQKCRKICSEVWKCSASSRHKPNQKTELFNEDVYVRLELYCSGLAVLSKNEQNFHLHRAVFENNLPVLRRVASLEQLGVFHASLNEIDAMGNTALMLAVRLRRLDAVLILCDLFADPKHRPLPHFQNAIDLAVKAYSKPILKILLAAC